MNRPNYAALKTWIRVVTCLFVPAVICATCGERSRAAEDPAPISIVPQPVDVIRGTGAFVIDPKTRVVAGGPAAVEAKMLVEYLAPALGYRLELHAAAQPADGTISLRIDPALKLPGEDGYRLEVTATRVDLSAAAPAGLFYGIQTLRQLLPAQVFSAKPVDGIDWTVPSVTITDGARFGWRGLLIDPARHFIPVDDVKLFIDTMAMHKLNRLQMHLTDDQGWRIEIKKYPKLTEVGSWRDETLIGHAGTRPWKFDGKRHGGFYTQDDVRDLVRYAAKRHITIVPEIEMPGHFRAAISAYPHLGVFPEKQKGIKPWTRWGISEDILAPRPAGVAFCKDVLTEVMDLFPGKFIHVGGDEAIKTQWRQSDEIKQMIRDLDLDGEEELQGWFIRQIDAFLTEHGRRLIGWDEILQGGLAPGATVMSWRGESGGVTAARAGHDVVMAPTSHTYFDYYQGPREKEPLAIGGYLPLERVYDYEPIPADLNEKEGRRVLGAQAQLWNEYNPTTEHHQYMTFPRACALAEVLWSPKPQGGNRNFDSFLLRLDHHLGRLDAAGVNYRPLDRKPMRWPGRTDANAPQAARALVERLLPEQADRFEFETIPPEQGRDVFEIHARDGVAVIRGNTGVSMAMGLNWYLKHYCNCHVSWYGDQLALPAELPAVETKVRHVSWAKHRYFLNYCCFGYSLPWWDWQQWERLIDWMALNGINAPLSVTGQEAVWRAVGERLEFTDEQTEAFLAGPPYLPFGWMGCLDGWGGPLPADWNDRHEQLQKKILARERELGMTPVLQGFTGHVPAAVAEKFPEAKLHKIHWIEWQTHLLDPLDPLFGRFAKIFLEEQTRRFGTDHLYAADTFIEMTPPSGELDYLDRLSKAIYAGMADTDPEAVWVLQGWTFMNQKQFWTPPRFKAFLDAVPDERMLVLDLFCESTPMWSRTDAFCGKPWVWCNVQSFGRNVHLGGALERNNSGLIAARQDPNGGKLAGLGFVNEGLCYNPVVYDQMFEMAWRNEAVDLDRWIEDYARHRYGRRNAHAAAAWAILKDTVYAGPARTRSIIDHVPSLRPGGGVPYDNVQLAAAWRHLMAAGDELGRTDTYRFDLVNVARQVLANHAATLQQDVAKAWTAGDVDAFAQASERYLQLMRDVDRLLATRSEFLLGRCLENAKRWGTTDAERARMQWNARRVLTLWGTGKHIRDYARKEWSGMIGGYYLKRWEWYLREAGQALADEQPFDDAAFYAKLLKWEGDWADGRETYPTEPAGDSLAIAAELWAKYGDAFKPDSPSLTTGKPATCSKSLPPYPARLANDGYAGDTNRFWAMDAAGGDPAWWQVDLEKPTEVDRVTVVFYYGDNREYGFRVETSLDGKDWQTVADRTETKVPATREGTECKFPPRKIRYLRVVLTHNSANTGRHLVEVMAFGP